MKTWAALLSAILPFLVSCATTSGSATKDTRSTGAIVHQTVKRILGSPEDPYLAPIPDAPPLYREAFAKLEAGDSQAAADGFEKFLRDQPTTNWTLAAQFNRARALENLGQYGSAAKLYQETAEKARKLPKLQGLALLRQAVVLEAMGEDDRSLAALKDAEKRADKMSPEIAQTELPARLAAAYARARNFSEADRYYTLADRQLSSLRASALAQERPEWLPRVLYGMGHRAPGPVPWDRFEANIVPLERSQIYLLQSAEYGVEPWASQAANELIEAYVALRVSIDAIPTPAASEIVIAAREQQQERWKRLVRLSDAIASLRALLVTEIEKNSPENSPIRKISEFSAEFEEALQSTLMLDRPVGEAPTPESLRRKESVRGRAISPKPAFPGEGSASDDDSKDEE